MTGPTRGILWDFDGTLAYRTGLWSDMLVDCLDAEATDHGCAADAFRTALSEGFPWHAWETPHPPWATDEWWPPMVRVLERAFLNAGIEPALAARAAARARAEYLHPERWRLFPETLPVLDRLRGLGWRHVIVSNHVPELPELVDLLGMTDRFEAVFTSAATGYEKPHPEAFALGRAALGDPDVLWMVGDNPRVDVDGAERAGIPAILVRSHAPDRRSAPDLLGVDAFVLKREPAPRRS